MFGVKEVEFFPDGIEVGNVGAADAGRQGRHGIAARDGEEVNNGRARCEGTRQMCPFSDKGSYFRVACSVDARKGKKPQNGNKTPRRDTGSATHSRT